MDYLEVLECKLDMSEICQLLNRLSIPWSIDRVNKDIVHLIIWRNGSKFRLRFINEYGVYKFTGFLDG